MLCDFLDEFFADIFRVELAQEQERHRVCHSGTTLGTCAAVPYSRLGGCLAVVLDGAGDILILHPLVKLEPGDVALGVLVLKAEVPSLPQADGPTHQIKQLLTRGLQIFEVG